MKRRGLNIGLSRYSEAFLDDNLHEIAKVLAVVKPRKTRAFLDIDTHKMLNSMIIYSIVIGIILCGLVFRRLIPYAKHFSDKCMPSIRYLFSRVNYYSRRYFLDPPLHRFMQSIGLVTPLHMLWLILLSTTNFLAVTYSRDRAGIIKACGNAFLINLALINLSGRDGIIWHWLLIPHNRRAFLHTWLGVIAIAECIAHTSLALISNVENVKTEIFRQPSFIAGFIVSSGIYLISEDRY